MLSTEKQFRKPMDTLYYDGSCPICSTEIDRLATQLTPDASETFVCVDINAIDDLPLDREALFSQLHVQRADGSWVVGLEANVLAWEQTRWRPLVRVLTWPVVRWFADMGYQLWLRWYQRQRAARQSQSG